MEYAPFTTKTSYKPAKEPECAIDPGVRTIYSETSVSQIKVDKERLKKYLLKIDTMRSLRGKKQIKKKRSSKKERQIQRKIGNLVDELHHKTINYLTDRYDTIVLPPFESQEIVKKSSNSSMNRSLLQLKHYKFRMRLGSKCEMTNRTMINTTEEFTSKTCSNCGNLKNDLGASEIYRCNSCKLIFERDVNGSRNIFIKYRCKL